MGQKQVTSNAIPDTPLVPPPVQRTFVHFNEIEPSTNLQNAKGTFVVRDVGLLNSIEGFKDCPKSTTGPTPDGLYVVMIGELPSVTKQALLDAQQANRILLFDVDYFLPV